MTNTSWFLSKTDRTEEDDQNMLKKKNNFSSILISSDVLPVKESIYLIVQNLILSEIFKIIPQPLFYIYKLTI